MVRRDRNQRHEGLDGKLLREVTGIPAGRDQPQHAVLVDQLHQIAGGLSPWHVRCIRIAEKQVDGLMRGRRLQVRGSQAGLPGEDLHGRGAKSHPVVVGKKDIGPAGTFEDSVGRAGLAFDPPADPEQRSQSLRRFDGRPVLDS